MNVKQQWVTVLMGLAMLATIFAMPAADPSKRSSELRKTGAVVVAVQTRAETPEDQVRDLTY